MITEMYRKSTYESEDTYSGADEPELYTSTAEGWIPLLFYDSFQVTNCQT